MLPRSCRPWRSESWNLRAFLVTHHHGDHVGGLVELQAHAACPVYAPATETIPGLVERCVAVMQSNCWDAALR